MSFHFAGNIGNKNKQLSVIFYLIVCTLVPSSKLMAQNVDEYELKSAYVERITRFVTWPNEQDENYKNRPFIICIAGNSKLYNNLISDYTNIKIKGKDVIIKKIASSEELQKCDLLFISEDQENEINDYIEKANQWKILILGETEGFCAHGVHINFYIEDEFVRFEVNLNEIERCGFIVGSLLLNYARIVNTDKKR